MGLFGKKEPCPVCGGAVTGLMPTKIGGGKALCRSCGDRIAMQKELRKAADLAFIKEHLAYRESEAKLVATMLPVYEFRFGDAAGLQVNVDEAQQLLSINLGEWNTGGHPVVLRFSQLVGYELWRQNKKVDDDKTSGETFSETVTSALGKALGTTASENDTFTIKLKTTNKYWPEMELEIFVPKHMQYTGLINNMKGIGQLFKCIVRGEKFVLEGVSTTN